MGRLTKAYLAMIAFSIFGTLLSRYTGMAPGPIKPIASILTMLFGVMALARFVRPHWVVVAVFAVGAMSELVGLYTGYPFGSYRYTTAWQPVVLLPAGQNFPLLLPLAWFLVVGASHLSLPNKIRLRPLAVASLATLIDFLMEPVMVDRLGYWKWEPRGPLLGGAAWLNPIGWLLVSLVGSLMLTKLRDEPGFKIPGARSIHRQSSQAIAH